MNRIQLLWERLTNRLDAMSLRERAMVFAAAVGVLLFLAYQSAIDPMLRKQKLLLEQIHQQNSQVSGIDMEIQAKVQAFANDPDAPVRAQVSDVRHQIEKSTQALMSVQKGLVAPDKIAPLLEKILHGNGRLKLVALRTLPVAGMSEAIAFDSKVPETAAVPPVATASAASMVATAVQTAQAGVAAPSAQGAAAAAHKPRELLYRHGVEIVLQGSYLDMVNYMDALEALPAQLFWGKAELAAGQYPNARLKLTLYTLSLDQKWMQI